MNEKLIIWDWNGTLLNDMEACLESINHMLTKRDMNKLQMDSYKQAFTFPVQNYYQNIGFDFNTEPFEKLSVEYIDIYKEKSKTSKLQAGTVAALEFFEKNNFTQIILSASEQTALIQQIKEQKIEKYFDSILGLNNIHARSKKDNAINYLKNNNGFKKIILIGDTYHDCEVAQAIGSQCILVMNGHQDLKRYPLNGNVKLIDNLNNINKYISCS